jgi:hypothetical protein
VKKFDHFTARYRTAVSVSGRLELPLIGIYVAGMIAPWSDRYSANSTTGSAQAKRKFIANIWLDNTIIACGLFSSIASEVAT